MAIVKTTDLNLFNKRVLLRSDLNVPIKDNIIISDARIRSSVPTIKFLLKQGAKVMLISHLGRPTEGEYDSKFSLQPIVNYLRNNFSLSVRLVNDYLDGVNIVDNELVVLENVRFNKGEKQNDEILAKKYAALCDIFVMDAFGVSHRTHASTCGVIKFSPISCAGPLLLHELKTLEEFFIKPARPMVAVVGGSKISTKLAVLNSIAKIADQLIVGGGIANTFVAAKGYNVGKSLCEINFVQEAKELLKKLDILVPIDVSVATEFSENAIATLKFVNDIQDHEQILDIGEVSIAKMKEALKRAKTILWNGPVGVFEFANFRAGTKALAQSIANNEDAVSIAGGGDTIAAIDMFCIANKISYISTGGGAFLKFVEGKKLPAVVALEECSNNINY